MPSPARVRWAKFRTAVVCLVALVIVGTLVYLLTGGTLFRTSATVYLYIADATGLSPASPVRVNGIGTGKVTGVALSGSNQPNRVIRVTMKLDRDSLPTIPADSYAELSSDDLAGDKFVDITSGKSLDHLQPGGEVVAKNQADFMKTLDLRDFEKQLRAVDVIVRDIEQGKSPLGQFVLGDQMYRDLRRRLEELQKGVRAAASTTSAVGQALYSDKLYRQVSEPLAGFDRTLADIQAGRGTAGQFLRDTAQWDQLRTQAHDLENTIRTYRSGAFFNSEDMYQGWNKSLSALIQQVQAMNADPMLSSTATYETINGMAKELRDSLRDFRQNPQKYLRVKAF